MAMLVFCALTSHKIYDRLTRHFRLDTTLVLLCHIQLFDRQGLNEK